MPPPIQIHTTSGEAMARNAAGGGSLRYLSASAATISACTSPGELPNLASASRIGPSSEPMSGRTASQKSR